MDPQSRMTKPASITNSLAELRMRHTRIEPSIELWQLPNLKAFLSSIPRELYDAKLRPPGFDILNRRFLARSEVADSYPSPEALPQWQRQERGECSSSEFDRALIARHGSEVVGIVHCEWKRCTLGEHFWAYELAMVDVHQAWRERGVATSLLQALDEQSWLSGKILRVSGFTPLGRERLPGVLKRHLRAKSYIVLAPSYEDATLPTAPGSWSSSTQLLSAY
jgi:GNAT superfamily N-acetyltransferase